MNVAFFGGSFNPPHIAHVMACKLVASRPEIDRVLVVPAYKHPFAKELTRYEDRVAMCAIALGTLEHVEVSRVEEALGGESRTLRTLEHLAAAHVDWRFRLVIGADILAEKSKWFAFDMIAKLAPPIVLGRAGYDAPETSAPVLPDVSSTAVRHAIAAGDWENVARLVPSQVVSYIRAHGLYGAQA